MKPSVFVGSSREGIKIAEQVQYDLRYTAECKVWTQGVFGLGWGTLESLMLEVAKHDFAILILTPDDVVNSRDNQQLAPRDNVLFELGLFMGRLGPKRVLVLFDNTSDLKIMSDLAGITLADYDGDWAKRDMASAIGTACKPIRDAIDREGFATPIQGVVEYGSKVAFIMHDHYFLQVDLDDKQPAGPGLRAVDKERAGTWETFELLDPEDSTEGLVKRPLRYGSKIALKAVNNRFVGADLNIGGFLVAGAGRLQEWETFTVHSLSVKTGIPNGSYVYYGHPIALMADNQKFVAYRSSTDKKIWATLVEVGAWEQFTFVPGADAAR